MVGMKVWGLKGGENDPRDDVKFRFNFFDCQQFCEFSTHHRESSHETLVTSTGNSYSRRLYQWTKASSTGFVTTNPAVQTPAASTPEALGPANASTWR